jgi:FAD/FMN-containing dehydrogenase
MGGAVAAPGDDATAFAERSMPYVLNAAAAWRDPEAAAAHIAWARAVIGAASEASTGRSYVNFLGDAGAARAAYGEETYSRLVTLKTKYDPHNVFARNQNIEPYPSGNGSAG